MKNLFVFIALTSASTLMADWNSYDYYTGQGPYQQGPSNNQYQPYSSSISYAQPGQMNPGQVSPSTQNYYQTTPQSGQPYNTTTPSLNQPSYQASPSQSTQPYYQTSPSQSTQPYYQTTPSQSTQPYQPNIPQRSTNFSNEQNFPRTTDVYNPTNDAHTQWNDKLSDDQAGWQQTQTARSDQEIRTDIQEKLGPGLFSNGYDNVTFDVNRGNVTLRGSVETAKDKTKVEDSVKKVNGVKNLQNDIQVTGKKTSSRFAKSKLIANETQANGTYTKNANEKYPNDYAATATDNNINAKIREKLAGGWFTKGYDGIIIRTANGIVVVTGIVDTVDDVKKINNEINKVEGVKKVENQISVKNQ